MKRGWIMGGWLFAMIASALLPLWVLSDRIERNHLGKYLDPQTGAWTPQVYSLFFTWWSPIVVPATLLALACMVLNRPDRR